MWGFWPGQTGHQELNLPASNFQSNDPKTGPVQVFDNTNMIVLDLDWPAEVWVGDQKEIKLSINPSAASTNLGDKPGPRTVHVVAESRLEIGPLSPQSGESLQQPWTVQEPLTFNWTIQPEISGVYEGNVWFYLNYVTPDGRIAQRIPVSDQNIQIQVRNMHGITPGLAGRVGITTGLGGLLLVISLVFSRKLGQKVAKNS